MNVSTSALASVTVLSICRLNCSSMKGMLFCTCMMMCSHLPLKRALPVLASSRSDPPPQLVHRHVAQVVGHLAGELLPRHAHPERGLSTSRETVKGLSSPATYSRVSGVPVPVGSGG